jgi:hypothetical protein
MTSFTVKFIDRFVMMFFGAAVPLIASLILIPQSEAQNTCLSANSPYCAEYVDYPCPSNINCLTWNEAYPGVDPPPCDLFGGMTKHVTTDMTTDVWMNCVLNTISDTNYCAQLKTACAITHNYGGNGCDAGDECLPATSSLFSAGVCWDPGPTCVQQL